MEKRTVGECQVLQTFKLPAHGVDVGPMCTEKDEHQLPFWVQIVRITKGEKGGIIQSLEAEFGHRLLCLYIILKSCDWCY
jgi:hypothetical protein